MLFVKPHKLEKGDKIAIVSPSWGGPGTFPHIYENAVKNLEQQLDLHVIEYPTTRASSDYNYSHPEARARDINQAFADPEIKGIISSIGGEDSVRILPYLDREIIRSNPKFIMGFSDTTTVLTFCHLTGQVTYYGPSMMAGLSQLEVLGPEFKEHLHIFLFENPKQYEYHPYPEYSKGYPNWEQIENTGKIKSRHSNTIGWKWIQGNNKINGQLFGGCIEVFEFLKGTKFWPDSDFWSGKILFFEISEENPTPDQVKYMLRNYGMQGILEKINAILFGRPHGYTEEQTKNLEQNILKIVSQEFKRPDLPIITNMDFGHTDPQFILPLGIRIEINCIEKRIQLLETPFSE